MKQEKSVSKKKPQELKVNWVVDLVDPPQPEEWLKPTQQWLSGVNKHLANALQVATAECARLATGRAAAEARVRELEEVLRQMNRFISSALPVGDAA